ncbi:MAG TPA: VOC family protein [Candidatus Sulfotelmatobacter sp.]|jgi:catechol 2,3-dioxygenase-like lactoylglutathione lyase family enzyme|nr:VOC family protein [Candidatus Sulfotelmatobacter sp.]
MKKLALALVFILQMGILQIGVHGQTSPQRPKILGIDHVSFYTTAPGGVKKLYGDILGLSSGPPVEPGGSLRYIVGTQWVGYSAAPDPKAGDRMDHVAFATDDVGVLREYLIGKGIKAPEIQERSDYSRFFVVEDPEGHRVEFVQRGAGETVPATATAVSRHMIHAGFLVYHREAEDHFYRDILGFRPYWHGGMKENETDWVSLQVPDGTDWLEYMLNQPQHPDLRLTGVMDHISLGVINMKKAQAILEAHGWKPHDDEKAQMGRDGKWQLNLYDPDFTRVELMEFKPVQKPCCSDFTGQHPSE